MKIAISAFLFLAGPVAASTIVDETSIAETFNDAPIIIKASCTGVDFGNLPVLAGYLAGKALQSSYNEVHGQSEHLSDVRFAGQVRGEENLAATRRYWGWNGSWGCEGCRAAMVGTGMSTKAWEIEFVATLLSTNDEAFKDVKTCDLMMLPSPDIVDQPNVDIQVKCTGGPQFDHLTLEQATSVSHALQLSYNDVHAEKNDGHLDNVIYHDKPTAAYDSVNVGATRRYWGWNGSWGCEGCSIAEVMVDRAGVSDASLQAWENKLVATLTQNGNADFAKIKSCDIKMSPHHLDGDEGGDEGETELSTGVSNVELSATCNGVDFETLPLADDAIVAQILQASYNRAHGSAGDSLSNVVFVGSRIAAAKSVDATRRYWGWNGSWGCEGCNKDDVMFVAASSDLQRIWGLEFTAGLIASGHAAFQSASDCTIAMQLIPANDKEEAELSTGVSNLTSTNNVELSATCSGIVFENLTLADDEAVAGVLEASYNQAHSGAGDSLADVVPTGSRIATEESMEATRRYWGWNGSWGCEGCRKDEVMLVVTSGILQQIWEQEFTRGIIALASTHPAFANAADCKLAMELIPVIDEMMVSTTKKCGLRACVE